MYGNAGRSRPKNRIVAYRSRFEVLSAPTKIHTGENARIFSYSKGLSILNNTSIMSFAKSMQEINSKWVKLRVL